MHVKDIHDPTFCIAENRKTLGQQALEVQNKYAGQKTQTVRETTDEMGKKYMAHLEAHLDAHKHLTKPYYLLEILRPNPILDGCMELHFMPRWTRPKPEWGLALYKIDNQKGEITLEWGLPRAEEAAIMMANADGWHPKLIQDIQEFLSGKLE